MQNDVFTWRFHLLELFLKEEEEEEEEDEEKNHLIAVLKNIILLCAKVNLINEIDYYRR